MSEIKVLTTKVKNIELLRSLIYQLEIKFQGVHFELSENSACDIKHNCSDQDLLQKILDHIQIFENNNARLGNRVSTKKIWDSGITSRLTERLPPESSISKHPGLWCHFDEIGEVSLILCKAFEKKVSKLGPKNISVPRLISKSDLSRIGHLPREEHQIAFLTVPGHETHMYALTPAVCLPCYVALEGVKLEVPAVYTFEGIAHRYEGGVFSENSLFRLREFKVREIICFGGEAEMQMLNSFFLETCKEFASIFEIPAFISTATDLFFHNEGAAQAFHQLVHQSKLEFKVQFEKKELAVSSFNCHGSHFSEAFNIGDGKLLSFCIGFGIDRLAYAVYSLGYSMGDIRQRALEFAEL